MKIAILVWGSLYWDQRELETTGEWFYDGPILPIEFARISSGNRLTLVIKNGAQDVTTLYAVSSYSDLSQARENLRLRESTENLNNIGFIDFVNNTSHTRHTNQFVLEILQQWNVNKGFDAITWSDFSPRFYDVTGNQLTLPNILSFLEHLPIQERQGALHYIRNAPGQITTQFRAAIEEHITVS